MEDAPSLKTLVIDPPRTAQLVTLLLLPGLLFLLLRSITQRIHAYPHSFEV